MERELALKTLSPLVLRADRSRMQYNPGLDYIPGSAIRGALAAAYLQERDEDEVFRALFVRGGTSFGDLLPSTEEAPGQLLPASARACKYYRLKHPASLTDSLMRLAAADDHGKQDLIKGSWEQCPECHEKRDRIPGYVTTTTSGYRQAPARTRVIAGTAIHRATGTAEAGMLYSQDALEENQVFRGTVRLSDSEAAETMFRDLETVLHVGKHLSLGAGRSRGTGVVEIYWWSDPPIGPPLESRWQAFNSAWKRVRPEELEICFSLTLTSHLLLRDRAGRPVTSLEQRNDLEPLLGLPNVRLGRHIALPATVRGWNALQGLPKEDEPAIGRGSVLLFYADAKQEATLRARFIEIEEQGLGRRRAEGFGRVRVCDPFHFQLLLNELEEKGR